MNKRLFYGATPDLCDTALTHHIAVLEDRKLHIALTSL